MCVALAWKGDVSSILICTSLRVFQSLYTSFLYPPHSNSAQTIPVPPKKLTLPVHDLLGVEDILDIKGAHARLGHDLGFDDRNGL